MRGFALPWYTAFRSKKQVFVFKKILDLSLIVRHVIVPTRATRHKFPSVVSYSPFRPGKVSFFVILQSWSSFHKFKCIIAKYVVCVGRNLFRQNNPRSCFPIFLKITNNITFLLVIYAFTWYILPIVVNWGEVLIFQQWLIDNRYISANVWKTDQVKMIICSVLGEMYPVGLCLHILPDVLWHR